MRFAFTIPMMCSERSTNGLLMTRTEISEMSGSASALGATANVWSKLVRSSCRRDEWTFASDCPVAALIRHLRRHATARDRIQSELRG
jgi:hypothetical protein